MQSVITRLSTAISNAGYLVEEIEGENKQITIEIKKGFKLPSNVFIDVSESGCLI